MKVVVARCSEALAEKFCAKPVLGSNLFEATTPYTGWDAKDAICLVLAARSLYTSDLVAAVDTDLPSHFLDSAQRKHFMRGSKESQRAAHRNGVDFIKEKAHAFSLAAARAITLSQTIFNQPAMRRYAAEALAGQGAGYLYSPRDTPQAFLPPRNFPASVTRKNALFLDPFPLAAALHALQDSFSPGHVRRVNKVIEEIYCYSEQDKSAHDHEDIVSGTGAASLDRSNAVAASAAFIEMALRSAVDGGTRLGNWSAFESAWLSAGILSDRIPAGK